MLGPWGDIGAGDWNVVVMAVAVSGGNKWWWEWCLVVVANENDADCSGDGDDGVGNEDCSGDRWVVVMEGWGDSDGGKCNKLW